MGAVSSEKKIELLSKAKALLHIPLQPYFEVFGLNVVEAFASGTPVVVTDNGAMRELVGDDDVGYVCDVNNLDEGIRRIENGEYDSKKCLERAKMFTVEKMTDGYLTLFDDVLGGQEW